MKTGISLRQLFTGLVDLTRVPDCSICGLALDSRRVGPGFLFLALPGRVTDGRNYLQAALTAGARVVACEAQAAVEFNLPLEDERIFAVPGLHRLCGELAARYYDHPSRRLQVTAVTGTNGKSTVCWLLAQALTTAGHKCAVIGTLGSGFPPVVTGAGLTTPDALDLQQQLANLRWQEAVAVAVELSSHGLDQYRDQGLQVNQAVFTNLSRDHLDYHGSLEQYGESKLKLFRHPDLHCVVVNDDEPLAVRIRQQCSVQVLGFGATSKDLAFTAVEAMEQSLDMTLCYQSRQIRLHVPLLGEFNASNIAAVAAVLLSLQIPLQDLPVLLRGLRAPPGRMEYFISADQRRRVVVDFAHTPDALERVLSSLRCHTRGQLWCVFGCGGDRDAGKRGQMGAIAERLADHVVITDDNARHEAPEAIVADIKTGMKQSHRVIHDRWQAIHTAVVEAGHQDLVLVAGKGHEQTQQIGDECLPFSDRDVVRELLELAA